MNSYNFFAIILSKKNLFHKYTKNILLTSKGPYQPIQQKGSAGGETGR